MAARSPEVISVVTRLVGPTFGCFGSRLERRLLGGASGRNRRGKWPFGDTTHRGGSHLGDDVGVARRIHRPTAHDLEIGHAGLEDHHFDAGASEPPYLLAEAGAEMAAGGLLRKPP